MNFKLIIHDVYVSDICQKCTLYFCSSLIDICQKCNRLRQMPVVWMRFIYNSMHFRFGNNRCCLPRQEIICLFIYCTIWFPETFSSKWIINCFHHFCSKLAKTFPNKIKTLFVSQVHYCTFCKGALLSFFFVLCLYL